YGTDHPDISIESIRQYIVNNRDPYASKGRKKEKRDNDPQRLFQKRNKSLPKRADAFPELKDFYNEYDELEVTEKDRKSYEKLIKGLSEKEKKLLGNEGNFYVVSLKNNGGLVMPVILKATYEDDTTEEIRLPAQIWRRNPDEVSKMIFTKKKLAKLELDPHREIADVDVENNYYPRRILESTFRLNKPSKPGNPLRDKRKEEAEEKKKAEREKKAEQKKK
ncbi:uncharacterized protein METZ01_LOCUS417493, partial [marine metagenome]